jgi:glycosyltransferase involved in cell wall biosynthesis
VADGSLSSPLRVLLVHNRYQQPGGEDAVFETQAALLESAGHEVRRLVVANESIGARLGAGSRLRLAAGTTWSRAGVGLVRRTAGTFRPDVMHVHNFFPLLSPAIHSAAHEAGAATVQTLHNYRLICPSANLFRDARPCHDCVGRRVAWPGIVHACYRDSRLATGAVAAMLGVHRVRRTWHADVDRFVALTSFARELLVEGGLPGDRIVVQPNVLADEPAAAEGPGDGFLFVGRLAADKGVATLLAAWERLAPTTELRIAGAGPLEQAVIASAQRLPNVRYLGRLDRPAVLAEMRRSRAVIVPSHWYEAFPLTVLEAFASGRPVIAAGHGSLAEIVTDGQTGLLVRPADPVDLRARVTYAQEHPEEMAAAGRAARAEFLDRYTASRGLHGLLDVYRQALEQRDSGRQPGN